MGSCAEKLSVATCQVNVVVGDIAGNVGRVVTSLQQAREMGAQLAVLPELAITGYPPEDLLLKPGFVQDNIAALDGIAQAARGISAVVGFVDRDAEGHLFNAAALCQDGRVVGMHHKWLLPNYGVFDELRYFRPGGPPAQVWPVDGVPVGMAICEDVWAPEGPVASLASAGACMVVVLNGSPFALGQWESRVSAVRDRAREAGVMIMYVNLVGGQDELVFDGGSFVVDCLGEIVAMAPRFREGVYVQVLPINRGARLATGSEAFVGSAGTVVSSESVGMDARASGALDPTEEVYEALVLGTRDYVRKNGFSDVVIGLSGGIDSSLVATVAADALGPEHVHGVAMPSRYSSVGSLSDAAELAGRLRVEITTIPIEAIHEALAATLAEPLGSLPSGLTDENLQSRLRGVLLMALSNARGWLVLTTGNKSELATGYSTLYGDAAGGFAVLKDVPKTLVYALAQLRNARTSPAPIPDSVLVKAPSAELRPGQRDDESLPPYDVLDPILAAYIEHDRTPAEIVAQGFDPDMVARVVRLVDRAEYKRRQMAPGVRVTPKAFGRDRRMPITNGYLRGSGA